jgi:hypothetical protein
VRLILRVILGLAAAASPVAATAGAAEQVASYPLKLSEALESRYGTTCLDGRECVVSWMQGPMLAEDRVVWARAGRTLGDWNVLVGGRLPPDQPSTLVRLGTPSTNHLRDAIHRAVLLASPRHVGYFDAADSYPHPPAKIGPPHFRRLDIGSTDGLFRRVGACSPATESCEVLCEQSLTTGPVVGIGDDLLVVGDRCPSTLTWHVLDLSKPGGWTLVPRDDEDRPTGERVVVAGQLFAWRSTTDVVTVVDAPTGATVARYSVGASAGWDLQADGKIAVARRFEKLGWMTPANPTMHELSVDVADVTHVRIVRDRVAALAAVRDSTGRRTTTELVVAGLDGGVHTVARFGAVQGYGPNEPGPAPPYRLAGFDFDGQNITWTGVLCTRAFTYLGTVNHALATPPDPASCSLPRILTRRARVSRGGSFAVRLSCPRGCRGSLEGRNAANLDRLLITKTIRLPARRQPQRVVLRFGREGRVETRSGQLPLDVSIAFDVDRSNMWEDDLQLAARVLVTGSAAP